MQAITGVFLSEADAHRAVESLLANHVAANRVTLLTPGSGRKDLNSIAVDATEQPGMGKAVGALIGGASGLSGGGLLIAALIPGVGPVTAIGLLGAAILGAAGASVGAAVGGSMENGLNEGLPEDEIFVYEDALLKGRTVVIALAEDATAGEPFREVLTAAGAETVDAARQKWWIGLRSAEQEHYAASGRNFQEDERFYRLGFESALHAASRCKEFDQTSAEMESEVEELEKQYPGVDLEEPYTRGYRRGREYYQRFCNEQKAA